MPSKRTLASQTITLRGRGLFSGVMTSVVIAPAPRGGIVFHRFDLPGRPSVRASLENVISKPEAIGLPADFPLRNTTLLSSDDPPCWVMTVEHILSALAALDVYDAIIAVDGPEVPILDGSAADFLQNMLHVGLGNIGWTEPITIDRELTVEDGKGGRITCRPTTDPVSTFTYQLDYGAGAAILPQEASWSGDTGIYLGQVAPARTFCLEKEAQAMRAAGMFRDFSPSDLLVFDSNGSPIDNALRYHDEPARHKLLDLIGDLALLGRPILGEITATRSGHALTHELSRMIASTYPNQD